jgi:hypothetical protein
VRFVVAGVGPSGRSRVERSDVVEGTGPSETLSSIELWTGRDVARTLPDRPTTAQRFPVACPPGGLSWLLVHHGPGASTPIHRTDTLDCYVVLGGWIRLVFEEDPVELHTGDMALVPGIAHGWEAGPEGCTVSAAVLGLEPAG